MDLYDAVEVRSGWNTDRFNAIETKVRRRRLNAEHDDVANVYPGFLEEQCFSIVFENKSKTIDLIAPDKVVRNTWLKAIRHVTSACKSNEKSNEYDNWIADQFRKADANSNGSLTFKECSKLLKSLNVEMSKSQLKVLFKVSTQIVTVQ